MKLHKILGIFALLLLAFSSLSHAIQYDDVKHEMHFDYPEEWALSTERYNRTVHLVHPERIATVSVAVYYFESPVTANGFQKMRMGSRYDGWLHKFERAGKEEELQRSGAEDSYVALYGKHILDRNMTTSEMIVGEYYYIKDKRSYVITMTTKKSYWKSVQPVLKSVVSSFWVGKEQPVVDETVFIEDSPDSGWTMVGRDSRNQFSVSAQPAKDGTLKKKWSKSFPRDKKFEDALGPLLTDSKLFFVADRSIYAFERDSGEVLWSYPLSRSLASGMAYANELLYVVLQEGRRNILKALYVENGNVLFSREFETSLSHLVYSNGKLFVQTDSGIESLDAGTGETVHTISYDPKSDVFPALDEGVLVGVSADNMVYAHSEFSGQLNWAVPYEEDDVLFAPTLVNGGVVVCIQDKSSGSLRIQLLSLKTGSLQWEFKHKSIDFFALSPPSAADNSLIIPLKISSYTLDGDLVFKPHLVAFDLVTGEIQWQQPILIDKESISRPVLTDGLVFLLNHPLSPLMSYDQMTGEQVAIQWDREIDRPSELVSFRSIENSVVVLEAYSDHSKLLVLE